MNIIKKAALAIGTIGAFNTVDYIFNKPLQKESEELTLKIEKSIESDTLKIYTANSLLRKLDTQIEKTDSLISNISLLNIFKIGRRQSLLDTRGDLINTRGNIIRKRGILLGITKEI